MLISDRIIEFKSSEFPGQGAARVRTYQRADRGIIALVTELHRNPGPSITNAAEIIANILQNEHGADIWIIEHYPCNPETFDLVKFNENGMPTWISISREKIIAVLGEEPAPHTPADEPAWLQLAAQLAPRDTRIAHDPNAVDEALFQLSLSSQTSDEPIYRGIRDHFKRLRIIFIDRNGAREIAHYVRHSPSGFAVGYRGSGPAETARCILADALNLKPDADGNIPHIERLYQRFKTDVIAELPDDDNWFIRYTDIIAYTAHASRLT